MMRRALASLRVPAREAALAAAGIASLGVTALLFLRIRNIVHTADAYEPRRLLLTAGIVISTMLIAPAARRLAPEWLRSRSFSLAMLPCCALFFAWFLLHFGNRQFGAWDFNITIDTGWRQMLGQRPYVDFITPNPPLFNLGILVGFRAFGVSWTSQLVLATTFCIGTFLWIYWLLRRLYAGPLLSLALAFGVQAVAMLMVCFWWYNGTSEVAAVVFLLSALACAWIDQQESQRTAALWLSYASSLGLLLLAKPNIAGLMILSLVILLLVAARRRSSFALATLAGFGIAGLILLAGHVSVPALVASYRGAAIERGGLHFFGVTGWSRHHKEKLLLWVALFAAPLLWLTPMMWREMRQRRWRELAYHLALIVPAPVALYCMLTNAENKESETAILFVAIALAICVGSPAPSWLRSFFAGMTLAAVVVSLYFGASRQRVFGIGPGLFFEAHQDTQRLSEPFFRDLHTTPKMVEVQREVHEAVARFPGKTFLGPRLEYDYAALQLPSPRDWPVYYQPGVSFARRDTERIDEGWRKQQFRTLIFLAGDRTFYGEDLLHEIASEYQRQPGFSAVEVYTRR